MQKISRATDTIWRTANDEPFTDEQFARIYNLYHEGHQLGTHHREMSEFLADDPLASIEEEHRQNGDYGLNQAVISALNAATGKDEPDYIRYAGPSWYGKGYQDGRGGTFHSDGLHPFKDGWRYDPPTPEDPMRRNGPW